MNSLPDENNFEKIEKSYKSKNEREVTNKRQNEVLWKAEMRIKV
jgi:hypothetical protein